MIGYNNKEIAQVLSLTESTVETYRKRLKAMLGSLSNGALNNFIKRYEG